MEDSHFKTGDSSHQEVGSAFALGLTLYILKKTSIRCICACKHLTSSLFLLQDSEDSAKGK